MPASVPFEKETLYLFLSCASGVEPLLEQEVRAIQIGRASCRERVLAGV